ncbi:hypothetical protein [Paenibacillus elgii]|uniref:hypothetical protein n=1 Tax=Paenibacillus elgii TaxID=189691 RepID=UPI000248D36B|nr:hypothetical protein [Paenibacillus elgii]
MAIIDSSGSLRGYIFQYELLNMMKHHPAFADVKTEVDLGNGESVDIVATYDSELLLIECRSGNYFSNGRLEEILKRLLRIKSSLSQPAKVILAFRGELTSIQTTKLSGYMVNVWDINTLASLFSNQIQFIRDEELKSSLQAVISSTSTIEDELLEQLKTCTVGRDHWSKYQKICASIFEHLFSPHLGRPITELPDYAQANRRDIIMANYAESGFWYYLRERYNADFIVIDAKNHSTKIDKNSVLQMANYLKAYGTGLFGIISCRSVPKESATHTQREIWMASNKLIIFLNDSDIEQMLSAKKNITSPEEIIKQKIEDFRLSL